MHDQRVRWRNCAQEARPPVQLSRVVCPSVCGLDLFTEVVSFSLKQLVVNLHSACALRYALAAEAAMCKILRS